jgi:ABC-type Na+ efflux pump permease subunit
MTLTITLVGAYLTATLTLNLSITLTITLTIFLTITITLVGAYLTCVEVDPTDPLPLYRFVSISRIHNDSMNAHSLQLLGMHFLSLLAEYESTRLRAIENLQKLIDKQEEEEAKKKQAAGGGAVSISRVSYLIF